MLRSVALVITHVSVELSASNIRVTRIGELGTTLAYSSQILVTMIMEALRSSETSVLTRATLRNISEEAMLYPNPPSQGGYLLYCGTTKIAMWSSNFARGHFPLERVTCGIEM
jgi:hypothetical protein